MRSKVIILIMKNLNNMHIPIAISNIHFITGTKNLFINKIKFDALLYYFCS